MGPDGTQSLVTCPGVQGQASALGSGPGPVVPLSLWLAEGRQTAAGSVPLCSPQRGWATLWLPQGLLGTPTLLVLNAPRAWGRGIWLPQPGRCCRQLEAQQAKVMDVAEPPGAGREEAALP